MKDKNIYCVCCGEKVSHYNIDCDAYMKIDIGWNILTIRHGGGIKERLDLCDKDYQGITQVMEDYIEERKEETKAHQ